VNELSKLNELANRMFLRNWKMIQKGYWTGGVTDGPRAQVSMGQDLQG
jgi:hypothetical protein